MFSIVVEVSAYVVLFLLGWLQWVVNRAGFTVVQQAYVLGGGLTPLGMRIVVHVLAAYGVMGLCLTKAFLGLYQWIWPDKVEPKTIYMRVVEKIRPSWIDLLDLRSVLLIAGIVLLVLLIAYLLGGFFRRNLLRISMRLRGIQPGMVFESMQSGSEFVAASLPECQVPLHTLGMFKNSFLGFGLRVASYLVVPTHVVQSAMGEQIVMSGKLAAGVVLSSSPVVSKVVADVTYFLVADEVWASLGIRTGKLIAGFEGVVSVVGKKEGSYVMSSGQVGKTQFLGLLKYSGSTVRGFSGAAYTRGSCVVGMHTGGASDYNIGVSSAVIMREVKSFVSCEGRKGLRINEEDYLPAEAHARNTFSEGHTVWTEQDIARRIAGARSGDWADQVDLEEAGITWDMEGSRKQREPRLSKEAAECLMQLPVKVLSELSVVSGLKFSPTCGIEPRLDVEGQSPGGATVTFKGDVCFQRFKALEKANWNIRNRIQILESTVAGFLGKRPRLITRAPDNQKENQNPEKLEAKPEVESNSEMKASGFKTLMEAQELRRKLQKKKQKLRHRAMKAVRAHILKREKTEKLSSEECEKLLSSVREKPLSDWPDWALEIYSELSDAQKEST